MVEDAAEVAADVVVLHMLRCPLQRNADNEEVLHLLVLGKGADLVGLHEVLGLGADGAVLQAAVACEEVFLI